MFLTEGRFDCPLKIIYCAVQYRQSRIWATFWTGRHQAEVYRFGQVWPARDRTRRVAQAIISSRKTPLGRKDPWLNSEPEASRNDFVHVRKCSIAYHINASEAGIHKTLRPTRHFAVADNLQVPIKKANMPTKSEKLRNKLLASTDDSKEPVDDAEWAAHEDQLSGKSGRRRKSPILSPIETDAGGRIEGRSGATNHGTKYAATVSDDVEFQIVPQSRVSFDPEVAADNSDDGSDKEASGAQKEIQQKRGRDSHNDPTSTKSSNMPSAAGSTISNKQPDDSDSGSKPTKSRSKGISPPQDNLVLDNELPEDLDERILAAVYENLPVWAKSAAGAAKRQKTPVDDVLLAENARKQIHSNIRESITKRTGLSGENEDTKKIDKEITTHMGAILGEILRYPLNEAEKRQAITRVLQVRRRNGDYYEALGIKKNAEQKEVGSAYRNLARLVYPDKNSDEEATNVAKCK